MAWEHLQADDTQNDDDDVTGEDVRDSQREAQDHR